MSSALQTSFSDAPAAAFIGQLDGSQDTLKTTGKNAEASASMPFGMPVAFKPSASTSDLDVTIPANSTDHLRGIVFRSDSYMPAFTDKTGTHGDQDANGLVPGVIMDIARRGRIWVKTMQAVVPGDAVFIAYASGGGTYTAAGQYGKTAAGGSAIDCTGRCSWDSTAAAGAGAWLNFDFTKAG